MKKLTGRQREILRALVRKEGQTQFGLGVPGHSGNVLEHLLAHDLIRIDVGDTVNRVYTTPKGRAALQTGRVTS